MDYCIEKGNGLIARMLSPCSDSSREKHETEGMNISSIIDAVLRVTTKVTESYASDILYEMDNLRGALVKQESYAKLLLFYESGVHAYPVEFLEAEGYTEGETVVKPYVVYSEQYRRYAPEHIQTWLLTHTPDLERDHNERCITTFRRMRISTL